MNALLDSRVAACLERLHASAAADSERRARRARSQGGQGAASADDEALIRMGDLYLAVSPAEGRLLYLLARGCSARRIVEFGASFGISTTYLAAAARDNGGTLVTTEVHPEKCAAIRRTLAEAGLDTVATLLEGDARETLLEVDAPVDFVFLDGWKSLYVPVLELLIPKLRAGALVAADNIDHEGAQDYARKVRSEDRFVSYSLGKMEVSCYTG